MADPDLNLLIALDVLLREGSVAGAARILGLSESAMSRTLGRLRDATGDALLVRAGRHLVPKPHAAALRASVAEVAQAARSLLTPAPGGIDPASLERCFTIRANEGYVDAFAPLLVATVQNMAPGVQLRFAPKPDKNVQPLRDGRVDLDIGVLGETAPEIKIQALFQDRFVGVVRTGHPLLAAEITPARYGSWGHVVASRRGRAMGPVDDALTRLGLTRRIAVVVASFPAALAVVAGSDLVGLVTASVLRGASGLPVSGFDLPVPAPPITVSQMWHPRVHDDPGHRWLRQTILAVSRPQPPLTRT